jgi:hypothetical protein
MAYREGSMGLAVLLGFIVYIGLTFLLGMFVNPFDFVMYLIVTVILAPLLTGVVAGAIARGSASRGFIAGFSAVVVGYYLMLLIGILIIVATFGTDAIGMAFTGGLGGAMGGALMIAVIITVLVVPIILGIIGGIGGAIISAMTASQVGSGYATGQTSTTNIIQAAPAAPSPVVIQSGATSTQAASAPTVTRSVICPACKAENDTVSTFCQSCGTRLKS